MKGWTKLAIGTGLAALVLLPSLARAEGRTREKRTEHLTEPPMEEPALQPMEEEERYERRTMVPGGMSISAGGGVADFRGDDIDDLTDVGGSWDARLAFGTRLPVGFEAAYVGTAQDIQALGLDDDAVLVSNGAEGLVRLNIAPFAGVSPFVVGGLSYLRYSVANDSFNNSAVKDEDDVVAVPLGAGISAALGDSGVLLDARFTYRMTFDEELLIPTTANANPDQGLSNWAISARIGYEF